MVPVPRGPPIAILLWQVVPLLSGGSPRLVGGRVPPIYVFLRLFHTAETQTR